MQANSFKIYPGRKLVSIRWSHAPSIEDWGSILELILVNPNYERGMGFAAWLDGKPIGITQEIRSNVRNIFERARNSGQHQSHEGATGNDARLSVSDRIMRNRHASSDHRAAS